MIKFKHVSSKTAFILGLFGFILYMGKINEVLANPDTLISGTLYKQEASWEISLGRFGIAILERFRQGIVNTTLTSCIAVLCAVAVSLLIIELFEISGSFRQVLCGAILIASPHVGCTLTYYYCSSFYMLSYLLAVLAVYLLTDGKLRHIIIGSILFAVSLSIYQSYITVAIAICYMYVLYLIIQGKDVKAILRQTLTYLVAGIGGGVLYLISNKIVQAITEITPTSARGFASMGSLDIRALPTQIIQIYKWFWEFFFGTTFMDNTWGHRCEINLIAFVIIILYVEVFLVTHLKNRVRILFTNVFLLLIPLALMSIVILAPEVSITGATGVLMLPAIVYVYIIPLTFKWEETVAVYPRIKKYSGAALTTGCILVCYSMIITESAGQTYIKHNMAKTESVAYALVGSVEELVDTSSNYKLCIVGNMEDGNYPELYSSLRSSQKWLTPYGKTVWTTYSGTQNSWKGYIQQFMGKTYNFCSESEYNSISAELIESMSNYPDEGSVEIIDDIILIKLSDASY